MLRRSCLVVLALFGASFALYFAFFTRYFEWPGNWFAAVPGSVCGALGLSGMSHLIFVRRETRAFRRAARREPFVDGATVVAAGPMRPLGAALTSPFNGRPCVAYEYDVMKRPESEPSSRGGGNGPDLTGYAMAASIIETPVGGVRLLGFPMLDEFPTTRTPGRELADRVRAYAASAPFERLKGIRQLRFLTELDEALADADGVVRKDYRLADDPIPLDRRQVGERVVEVGQQVCAIGRYDAAKRALVPRGVVINRLWPGPADAIRAKLVAEARSQARAGLVLFAISHTVLGLAFILSENRYRWQSERVQANAIGSAIAVGDVAALERAIGRGANPNAIDEAYGNPIILHVQKAAMVATLARLGANVNVRDRDDGSTALMYAVGDNDIERVRVLLAAGADVHAATKHGETALSNAIYGNRVEIAALLRAAGADAAGEPVERARPR